MFTQEEKSKLYDEALDRARQFSEHPLQENSADIVEYIFPKIKESEDERIRKPLIELVGMVDKNPIHQIFGYGDIKYSDMIAWLEKKELKKTEKNAIEPDDLIEDSYQQQADDLIDMVERKSAWSEDDDKMLNDALDMVEWYIGRNESKCRNVSDWLKSLKDRGTNNIKYVLPQREEGEPLIYYFERCIAKASPSLREMAFDVIKEIKTKHWKPSEDQVEALEYFVRSIGESGYASPYDNNTKLLYSLLEQIKKLRED